MASVAATLMRRDRKRRHTWSQWQVGEPLKARSVGPKYVSVTPFLCVLPWGLLATCAGHATGNKTGAAVTPAPQGASQGMKDGSRMFTPPLLQRLRQAAAVLFPRSAAREAAARSKLDPGAQAPQPAPAEGSAERRRREELALIRVELATLLNAMPTSRKRYPQLAVVEKAIASEGLDAIHTLPVDALQPALLQLESLCSNFDHAGLANLRSKMAVAIIDQGEHEAPAGEGAFRTAIVMDVSRQSLRREVQPQPQSPRLPERSEEEALASAYATLGAYGPASVTLQGELNSASARALAKPARTRFDLLPELALRDVRDVRDGLDARDSHAGSPHRHARVREKV